MIELPHTHACFVCGESNPIGFRLRFFRHEGAVVSSFIAEKHHCGFRETIHGGLIATVLDEAMAWVCIAETNKFAYCGELNTRFLEPLLPGVKVNVTARLIANRRDRIYETDSEITGEDGKVYAKA